MIFKISDQGHIQNENNHEKEKSLCFDFYMMSCIINHQKQNKTLAYKVRSNVNALQEETPKHSDMCSECIYILTLTFDLEDHRHICRTLLHCPWLYFSWLVGGDITNTLEFWLHSLTTYRAM